MRPRFSKTRTAALQGQANILPLQVEVRHHPSKVTVVDTIAVDQRNGHKNHFTLKRRRLRLLIDDVAEDLRRSLVRHRDLCNSLSAHDPNPLGTTCPLAFADVARDRLVRQRVAELIIALPRGDDDVHSPR